MEMFVSFGYIFFCGETIVLASVVARLRRGHRVFLVICVQRASRPTTKGVRAAKICSFASEWATSDGLVNRSNKTASGRTTAAYCCPLPSPSATGQMPSRYYLPFVKCTPSFVVRPSSSCVPMADKKRTQR